MAYLTATYAKSVHRKTTSEEDDLTGIRPHKKTTSQEDNLTGDNLTGR